MEDKTMSGQESLALIESMINKAKNQFNENGYFYLVWGWVVLFCSLVHYFVGFRLGYEMASRVWMLTWIVILYQVAYMISKKRAERVKTYTDDIVNAIWIVFAIVIMVTLVVIRQLPDKGFFTVLNPLILVIYGVPTFLSGIILRFNPLKFGGISCWLLALVAAFIDPYQHLLFIALAMVFAWIIPGYLLRSKFKKENNA